MEVPPHLLRPESGAAPLIEVSTLGSFLLTPTQRELVAMLHAAPRDSTCTSVSVSMLHGGFSGSVVVVCQAFDGATRPLSRTVIKLDPDVRSILSEKAKMENVRSLLGENAPRPLFSAETEVGGVLGAALQARARRPPNCLTFACARSRLL